MPSSNGVYSLPPGYLAATGTTIQVSQHNPIFEDVAAALTARLSRDGTAPMTGPINLAAGSVTAPSLIFTSNVQTGFYPTTNGIGVGIGGTQVAEFLPGGINGAFSLGMLIPFAGTTAPSSLWALPFGQTLLRTAYPDLWTFAQTEITNGNLLYNSGDGSTTFGIPDMRGRVAAGWDAMGGTAAGRLTLAGSGVNGAVLGSVGGGETHALVHGEIPTITSAASGLTIAPGTTGFAVLGTNNSTPTTAFSAAAGPDFAGKAFPNGSTQTELSGISVAGSVTSSNTGGTSPAHANVQPTFVCNYLLFVGD